MYYDILIKHGKSAYEMDSLKWGQHAKEQAEK